MSTIGKRLADLARSNLNSLLDKAAEAVDPRRRFADATDAELEEELARRKALKSEASRLDAAKESVDAKTGPAKAAPPPTSDRAAREAAAKAREGRVKAARDARKKAEDAATAGAAKAKAAAGAAAGAARSAVRDFVSAVKAGGRDPVLAKHYEVLEVTYGSDWDTVKVSYRRMMRRYHPDLHSSSPEKLKAATEVSTALTVAYNELEKHLLGGPNRK